MRFSLLLLAAAAAAQTPNWLQVGGEIRLRTEAVDGIAFQPDARDFYLLSRARLSLKLLPLSWLKFNFQGQDARVFGKNQTPPAPPYQDTFDLRQAYVEIGDTDKRSVGLRVGRQELNYGTQRLVGSSNWSNASRTFDAARLTLRGRGLRLDAFAASVVVSRDGEWNHHQQGSNLHGLYGGIERLIPKAVIEPYFYWRVGRGVNYKTAGARWNGKLPRSFDYSLDMAHQTGGAWAGHWIFGRSFATRFHPRLASEYNYSGNKFAFLYPTTHDRLGLSDQVGWRNIRHVRALAELKPTSRWTASTSFNTWWLADERGYLYNAPGTATAHLPAGAHGRHVGWELDAQAARTLNKYARFSFGAAHLFPGAFLKMATPGHAYTFAYVMLELSL